MSWIEAAIRWYAVLAATTWALAPGVRWLCDRMLDRGATITRPLAILGAVYPAWLVSSVGVAEFGAELVWLTLALGGAVGWILTARRCGGLRPWLRNLVATEFATIVLFAAYLWLRGFTPEILGT